MVDTAVDGCPSILNCDTTLLAAGAGVDWLIGKPKLKLCDDRDEELAMDVVWLQVRLFSDVRNPEPVASVTFGAKVSLDWTKENVGGCFGTSLAPFCLVRLNS